MDIKVNVWEEDILLPTYGIGKPEKNPMFFENRVYQGSSGVVYPYPVIEKISDTCQEETYIIRKTKCSPLFKRSDISYKTKRPPKNNFPKYSRGSKKNTGKFCFSQCFFL